MQITAHVSTLRKLHLSRNTKPSTQLSVYLKATRNVPSSLIAIWLPTWFRDEGNLGLKSACLYSTQHASSATAQISSKPPHLRWLHTTGKEALDCSLTHSRNPQQYIRPKQNSTAKRLVSPFPVIATSDFTAGNLTEQDSIKSHLGRNSRRTRISRGTTAAGTSTPRQIRTGFTSKTRITNTDKQQRIFQNINPATDPQGFTSKTRIARTEKQQRTFLQQARKGLGFRTKQHPSGILKKTTH